jgi:hypothetical protein
LSDITKRFGAPAETIELVKLDIEGAEVEVIDWMCDHSFLPNQILIEFDEMTFPGKSTPQRVRHATSRLEEADYALVYFDGRSNCTYRKVG